MRSMESYIVSNWLLIQFSSIFRQAWLLVIQSVNINSDEGRLMLKKVARACKHAGADITDESSPGLQRAIIQHIEAERDRSGITMHPFLPTCWSKKRFRGAILQEHGDTLPTLLSEAKTIFVDQIAQADEPALSGAGNNPTENVEPAAEETTPNSQVTTSEEQEPTMPAEREIVDILGDDPDLLSGDDEEPATPAMATLTSVIPTRQRTATDLMTPTTINANGIMTTAAADTNVTDAELAAMVDKAMERHTGT